jgi:hypothetical protein
MPFAVAWVDELPVERLDRVEVPIEGVALFERAAARSSYRRR